MSATRTGTGESAEERNVARVNAAMKKHAELTKEINSLKEEVRRMRFLLDESLTQLRSFGGETAEPIAKVIANMAGKPPTEHNGGGK